MPLHNVFISEADANAAKYDMFEYPDLLVQKKMLCLRMKSQGLQHTQIASVLSCNLGTVNNYLNQFESEGYEGLKKTKYNQPVSDLDEYAESIEAEFRLNPPRTVKEAATRIEKMTGIKRSQGRIRAFLHRIGMNVRCTGQIPAKADVKKQREFHDQILQPILKKAQKGFCHVFFMDSAHFVLAPFIAFIWCFERVFVKAAPGRFRLNVIGAIHAQTKELVAFYNTSYITATTVVLLLERLAKDFSGKPIYIILDNARYQHCELVMKTASKLGIELIFLPPYSPNLNLIERLWKLVKQRVCAATYFEDSKAFQNAILNFLEQLNSESMKTELNSRLSLSFQLFDNIEKLAA